MLRFTSFAATAGLLALLVLSPGTVAAQAVTRAYLTDSQLQRGMIVKLTSKDKNKVEALADTEAAKMEGVIVAANDSPVTLSSTDATLQQVYVATTGRYNLLVSNQNGVIKAGDYLTISSLKGVAMKADTNQPIVAGKALVGFDGKSSISGTTSLKDSAGAAKSVSFGLIPVDINISHNPLEKPKESRVPGVAFLQSGAKALVNKTVDPSRLYLSLLILVAVTAIAGSILYGGVRSSMVSIGRNPLAKKSILRGLFQVVLVSIIIFIIGLLGVYLILKL
ncbi:MAG TPA: hypothetical protein VF575_03075 [Candidatus Saccharimonadales bacterium]|jgi:hypothetical protein